MPWKEPAERHSDDLIAAIERAAHGINHTLREGFKLIALHIAAGQGVDNSAAIEAQAAKLNALTSQLNQSRNP
jgi:hypothetical protein